MKKQHPNTDDVHLWSDRLLVEPIDEDARSAGGIIIPSTSEEQGSKMRIIALNETKLRSNPEIPHQGVKIGDIAIISKHAGFDLKVGGRDVKAVRSTDIIMTYEDDQ